MVFPVFVFLAQIHLASAAGKCSHYLQVDLHIEGGESAYTTGSRRHAGLELAQEGRVTYKQREKWHDQTTVVTAMGAPSFLWGNDPRVETERVVTKPALLKNSRLVLVDEEDRMTVRLSGSALWQGKILSFEFSGPLRLVEGSWADFKNGDGTVVARLTPEAQQGMIKAFEKTLAASLAGFVTTQKRWFRFDRRSHFEFETSLEIPATYTFEKNRTQCLIGSFRCVGVLPFLSPKQRK